MLDNCRIRWGQVQAVEAEHVVVRSRRLSWDGCQLELAPTRRGTGPAAASAAASFVDAPRPGQWLALHWDWVCDRLDPAEQAELEHWTGWQLAATNARLGPREEGGRVKFLVLWRMELSLLSREMAQAVGRMSEYGAALEDEGKLVARYHVVGAHGGAWIYDVESHEQFEQLLARAPIFNFARYEIYPLAEMARPAPGRADERGT